MDNRFCAVCAYPLSGGFCSNCQRKAQEKAAEKQRQRDIQTQQKRQAEQQKQQVKDQAAAAKAQEKKLEKARQKQLKKTGTSPAINPSGTSSGNSEDFICLAFAVSVTVCVYMFVLPNITLPTLSIFEGANVVLAVCVSFLVSGLIAKMSSTVRKLSWVVLIGAVAYFAYKFFSTP